MRLLIVLSVGFGAMRLFGEKSIAFQAAAHIFVGVLFTNWWFTRDRMVLWLAVGLSLLELFAALVLTPR
jgi:hypothetical protein